VVLTAEPKLIQNKLADSMNEVYVARALDKLGHRYIYKYLVFETKSVKGAFEIDFLVLSTVPFSTPLEVFGEYFHQGQMTSEDRLRIQSIESEMRGTINPFVIIYGEESSTPEAAMEAVTREIGRG